MGYVFDRSHFVIMKIHFTFQIIEISDESHTPEVLSVNSSLCDSGFTESLGLHCLETVLEWPKEHDQHGGAQQCTCSTHDHYGFEDYVDEIFYHRLSIEDKYHVSSCLDNQPDVCRPRSLSRIVRKPVYGIIDQVRHKRGCPATEDD